MPYELFADFYEAVFKENERPVRVVLDLACGTGTLSCLMAGRGYEMIAVDSSVDMLAVAAQKAWELKGGIQPIFLCQSMEELDLYGTVDAAFCSLDSLNYLEPEKLPLVFERLRLFIQPGGLLVFDINSPERLQALDGGVSVDEAEGLFCVWRTSYNSEKGFLFYGVDIFSRAGERWLRESEEHIEYAHQPRLLMKQLAKAGFTEIRQRRDGPQTNQGRISVVARNGRP